MKRFGFVILLATAAVASPIHSVGCAPTVEAAVAHLIAGTLDAGGIGFRVTSVQLDRVRNQRWAMVASCADPSLPQRAMLLPNIPAIAAQAAVAAIIVHTGEAVRVTSSGGSSLMTLSGTAVESGSAGQSIRVRLNLKLDGSSSAAIAARVIGAGAVEIAR